jgi:hypothetical protein
MKDRVFSVFADLVSADEDLQKAAMEGDAIVKLASIISQNICLGNALSNDMAKKAPSIPSTGNAVAEIKSARKSIPQSAVKLTEVCELKA